MSIIIVISTTAWNKTHKQRKTKTQLGQTDLAVSLNHTWWSVWNLKITAKGRAKSWTEFPRRRAILFGVSSAPPVVAGLNSQQTCLTLNHHEQPVRVESAGSAWGRGLFWAEAWSARARVCGGPRLGSCKGSGWGVYVREGARPWLLSHRHRAQEGTALRSRRRDARQAPGTGLSREATRLWGGMFHLPSTAPSPSGAAAQQRRGMVGGKGPWVQSPALAEPVGTEAHALPSCIPTRDVPETWEGGICHHGHYVDDANRPLTHTTCVN